MFISLDQIVHLLLQFRYLLLFPVSIVEGPIVTIIAGFLSSIGHMNFFIALGIVILGDLTGDSLYYYIGRTGREGVVLRYGKFLGVSKERIDRMDRHFKSNTGKTLLFGKFAHAVGTPILFAAGIAKVPYKKFLLYNIAGTVPKSTVLILVGYYFGSSYKSINGYLDRFTYIGLAVAIALIITYILFTRFARSKI